MIGGYCEGDSSLASFMSCEEECVSEKRECRKFEEGPHNFARYKTFDKNVEFKKHLHGVSDVSYI